MQKLKSVFRSASKKRAQQTIDSESASLRSSYTDQQGTSLDERRIRQSSETSKAGAQQSGRSRPISSVYDSRLSNATGAQPDAVDDAQSQRSHKAKESIASDYKAYLPALSPVHDSQDEQFMTLCGDRRIITGESDLPHEEDVANRDIDRYGNSLDISNRKPLPATPVLDVLDQDIDWKYSLGSTIRTVPPEAAGTGLPARTAGDEPRSSLPKPNGSLRENRIAVGGQDDIEREIEKLLDGVVDLRNTVDEVKDVQYAPAVTHEVVKPHEHEIFQHKIFREIHNYEYYHRIQPVYDLQILPPRHWIPNPNGEGLIEISADDLPSRTGNNRKWKIVYEHPEEPAESGPVWRTEPEIIEHPTTITAEGFERKETTIIYPPTLRDLSEYDGLVQPVHFDHKTRKRWLGEIKTMHKLRHELGQLSDPDLSLNKLGDSLPDVPGVFEVPDLSQSPSLKRKPITRSVPSLGESNGHQGVNVAV